MAAKTYAYRKTRVDFHTPDSDESKRFDPHRREDSGISTVIGEPVQHYTNEKDYSVTPIAFEARDGVKLKGVVYRPKNVEEKGAIIIRHGINGNRYDVREYAEALSSRGFLVLASDERGHGDSEGELNVNKMVADVSTAIDTLGKKYGYNEVGVIGYSLGGTVTSIAAAKDSRIKAAVSLSTPTSMRDLAETHGKTLLRLYDKLHDYWPQHKDKLMKFLNFPIPDFIEDSGRKLHGFEKKLFKNLETYFYEGRSERVPSFGRFADELLSMPDAIDYVPQIKVPSLWFGGSDDTKVTPPKYERKLYDAAGSERKELIFLKGDNHFYRRSKGTVVKYADNLFSEFLNPPTNYKSHNYDKYRSVARR